MELTGADLNEGVGQGCEAANDIPRWRYFFPVSSENESARDQPPSIMTRPHFSLPFPPGLLSLQLVNPDSNALPVP